MLSCESLTYKKIISNISYEISKKCIYFPSWSENNLEKLSSIENKKDSDINILFTGNIGESQNFQLISQVIKITDKKIKWHIVGEGRYFKEINNLKLSNKLNNLYLHGLKNYTELRNYVQFADIMLISLKKGKTFDSTIPGKFSTYINYNKFIFGLIGGETKDLINKYKIGYATDIQDPIQIKEKLENLLNKNINIYAKNFTFLRKIFSKELAIKKLNKKISDLFEIEKTHLIKNTQGLNLKKI